ncbi:hypothetical protein GCM10025782_23160 [Pedococcus ginsenosidimutans]|uniref:Uncharacterized protein n=1 Tax=Pedococcus ginsenosidimutans TaxID=490570 RepID=A0ABP8Y963_9MICO
MDSAVLRLRHLMLCGQPNAPVRTDITSFPAGVIVIILIIVRQLYPNVELLVRLRGG